MDMNRIRALAGMSDAQDTMESTTPFKYNDEIQVTGTDTGEYHDATGQVIEVGDGYVVVALHQGDEVEFFNHEIEINDFAGSDEEEWQDRNNQGDQEYDRLNNNYDDAPIQEQADPRPAEDDINYVRSQLRDMAEEMRSMGKPNRAKTLDRLANRLEKADIDH
jgi:hypothetical protein